MLKECITCHEMLPEECFYRHSKPNKHLRQSECKKCFNKRGNENKKRRYKTAPDVRARQQQRARDYYTHNKEHVQKRNSVSRIWDRVRKGC